MGRGHRRKSVYDIEAALAISLAPFPAKNHHIFPCLRPSPQSQQIMENPAGLLSRIHSFRRESPVPIPVPTWVRPPFKWSEATLNKAESMIDRFDSMWRSTGTARAGTPDTITVQVQRILKRCLTEYYKHCEGRYDSPDTTEEDFEKMCLYAFSPLIFEDRRDWGPIHRVSDLLSTRICMM